MILTRYIKQTFQVKGVTIMAWRKDWKKIEATVTKTYWTPGPGGYSYAITEAEGVNPVTGKKQTFKGRLTKNVFLGIHAAVTPRKGEKVNVYVDPDQFLSFPNRYDMRNED